MRPSSPSPSIAAFGEPSSRVMSRPPPSASSVTVKGFYLTALTRELASQGHYLDGPRFREFSDYPLEVAHQLVLECAQRLYPDERRSSALRRVGWIIYPTLLSTMIGRVIFGSLGDDVPAVLRAAGRGFEVSISEGRYEAVRITSQAAEVRVRNFHLFPDTFLVGIFEGLLARYGHAGAKVTPTLLSHCDVDLTMSW